MKELIEKIENIKNYQEKIDFLLSDEVVESLKDSKYIFNLFRSESEYRKKLFLSNLNFYKAVSPIELYLYIELQTDISKYEYLCNENVVNYIAQFDNIGTIIEKMENIKLIKKLILKKHIFKFLEKEYNYTPLLLFVDDDDIKDYIKDKVLPENIKEFYDNANISKLFPEEILYIMEHICDKSIIPYLNNEKVIEEIVKEPQILYRIYQKNLDKCELLSHPYFTDLLTKDVIDQIIYTNSDVKIAKEILYNPNTQEIIDGNSILLMMTNNLSDFKEDLEREVIANKFDENTIETIIKLIDDKTIYTYLYIILTKTIVKRINVIDFFSRIKVNISKQELKYIFNLVSLDKYKRMAIYDVIDKNVPLERYQEQMVNCLENFEVNEMIVSLKEEIKAGSICSNVNIKKIFDFLHKNPDYKVTNEYFEIILYKLFEKIKNADYPSVKLKIVPLDNKEGEANIYSISLNSRMIDNSLNNNLFAFSVFFHELTHIKQYNQLNKLNFRYETLKQVKEEILRDEIENYYDDCYDVLSLETEAYVRGKVDAIKYFYDNTKQIPEKGKFTSQIKKISAFLNVTYRKINGKIYSLEVLFDEIVDKNKIKDFANSYPILLLEYNDDGSKKTLEQIIMLYSKAKEAYLNNKTPHTLKVYIFYMKLIKDLVLENQVKVNESLLSRCFREIDCLKENDNQIYNEKVRELKRKIGKKDV